MAQSVHLELTADGAQIEGESSVLSLGRENTIECIRYSEDESTITIEKRIDRASPRLMKARHGGEALDATFRFYRTSFEGETTTEHYFTVTMKGAKVTSLVRRSPDVIDPDQAIRPAVEELVFEAHTRTWTHVPSEATFAVEP